MNGAKISFISHLKYKLIYYLNNYIIFKIFETQISWHLMKRSEEEEEEGVEESDKEEREAVGAITARCALFLRIKSSFCYKIFFALL
jgi:hypothetical protein